MKLLLFLLFSCAPALALTTDEISDLAAQTMDADPNLHVASKIVQDAGGRLALYGGNSREIVDFVVHKAKQLGGAEAYRKWLTSQPFFSTLDWHRVESDMDLMIIPGKTDDPALISKLHNAGEQVQRQLPAGVFYKSLDFHISTDFFKQFDPQKENLEPVSNILISNHGIEQPPELNVTVDGVQRNLAQWGAEQYASGKFDFRVTRDSSGNLMGDTYGKLRQVLRYVRYLSEDPDMAVSPQTTESIQALVADLQNNHLGEVEKLLSGPDTDRFSANAVEAVKKAQLYSGDALATRALLEKFGIAKFLTDAGVADKYLYEPLPHRSGPIPANAQRVGDANIVVRHRTNLGAAQNVPHGAIYESNGSSVFQKESADMSGKGIYGSTADNLTTYGEYSVPYPIDPNAIYNVDVVKDGDTWIIKTLEGIAKGPDGKPKIEPLSRSALIQNLIDSLSKGSPSAQQSAFQALGKVLVPQLNDREVQEFKQVMAEAAKNKLGYFFMRSFLQKPGTLDLLKSDSNGPLRALIEQAVAASPASATKEYLETNPQLAMKLAEKGTAEIAANPDALQVFFPTIQKRPDLVAKVVNYYMSHPEVEPTREFASVAPPDYKLSPDTAKALFKDQLFALPDFRGLFKNPENAKAVLAAAAADGPSELGQRMFTIVKIPELKDRAIDELLRTAPERLGECAECFPLNPSQDKILRAALLSGKISRINYGQLETFINNKYEVHSPQLESAEFLKSDLGPFDEIRFKLIALSPTFRQFMKSLPVDSIPSDLRLQAYIADPKGMASLIDDKLIRDVLDHPNYFDQMTDRFAYDSSHDPQISARVLKAISALPPADVPPSFRDHFPELVVGDVVKATKHLMSYDVKQIASDPTRSDLARIGPWGNEGKGRQFELALKTPGLTPEQRFALAAVAYQHGSESPEVTDEIGKYLSQLPEKDAQRAIDWLFEGSTAPTQERVAQWIELASKIKVDPDTIKYYIDQAYGRSFGLFGGGHDLTEQYAKPIAQGLTSYIDAKKGALSEAQKTWIQAFIQGGHTSDGKPIAEVQSVSQKLSSAAKSTPKAAAVPDAICAQRALEHL